MPSSLATNSAARSPDGTGERAAFLTFYNFPSRYMVVLVFLAVLLSAVGVLGVLRLHPDARIDLLADPNSAAFKDQALFADTFGADPVVIMAQPAAGASLITPDHIVGLTHLEGKLHQAAGVKKVYGPGTLVNTLAISTTRILLDTCAREGKAQENAARQQAIAAGKSQAEQDQIGQEAFKQAVTACAQRVAKAYPSLGVPAVNDPTFIAGVLLEADGQHVRPFWNWALPDGNHAIITVRLNRDASLDQVRHILNIVNNASSSSDLRELHDLRFVATGSPVLTLSVADAVFNALKLLVPLALLAVLIVALLGLGASMVLTIVVAALAALWTAGIAGLVGLPVTPATLVVLPVVLGLATDYFIQSVNRVMDTTGTMGERVELAAQRILPSTGLAAAATAAGMLAFVVSGIPLVRQFGLFMALGVVMAFVANYLVGLPLLLLLGRRFPQFFAGTAIRSAAGRRIAPLGALAPRVAMALVVVGLVGWAALPLVKVETDPAHLMPAGDQALAQADRVRREVGIAGEIDLVMKGGHPASPDAVKWLDQASATAVSQSDHDLKALQSLPGFLRGFNLDTGALPDAATTDSILSRIPSYFTGAVYSKTQGLGLSIFGLKEVTSVERDQALVGQLQRAAANPPAGYRAFPAGLSVVAAQALDGLQADQLRLTLLAIALILAVLLLGYRRIRPALLAILPTVVAAGAATVLLFLASSVSHTRASPITILLGGVVVAFATEFSVLWLARYRGERANGIDPAEAAHTSSARVGPAIAASALALIAGFAVLAISGVPTVRDFGIWSSLDLLIATAGVFALLPPLARRWYR